MVSIIEWEEGWSFIMTGINKLIRILEGEPEPAFDAAKQISLYTTIYKMCIQRAPYCYSEKLYDNCWEEIKTYNKQTVLPSLRKKHDEYLLRELVQRWSNHKIMVSWFSRVFEYVERAYVLRRDIQSMEESGLTCFRDLVYLEIQSKAKDVVLALIHKEREGEQIDRELLRNVIDVFIENGMEGYEKDFESFMLEETASYYSRKASMWIKEDSSPNYMLKSEECLKKEKEIVTYYLHSSSESKLVEKVQNELLVVVAKQLLENKRSGFRALLRDGKMDDLSRLFRLYHPIPQVFESIAEKFKQHITAEANAFIKKAANAATDQGATTTGGVKEKVFIELHDKYKNYVTKCFQDNSLFRKVLQEVFEDSCIKSYRTMADSSPEILATFCDYILTKGRKSEKLSDEAMEQTFERVILST